MQTIIEIEAGLAVPSKMSVIAAAKAMEDNPALVEPIFNLAISDRQPLSWRAAWVFAHMTDYQSVLLPALLPRIVKALLCLKNHSQRGCFFKVVSRSDFKVEEYGELLDFCIDILLKPTDRPSHKFYCLDLLEKFAIQIPELKPELVMVVEEALPNFETDVLKRKGNKWLKRMEKNNR